jgi:DNA-binding beta-propeller fold protein YncE
VSATGDGPTVATTCVADNAQNLYLAGEYSSNAPVIYNGTGGAVGSAQVSTVVGTANTMTGTGYLDTAAATARLAGLPASCMCFDSTSTYMYFCDTTNTRVCKIHMATGIVSTVAGGTDTTIDGFGVNAGFSYPIGICIDDTDTFLYVTENGGNCIRRINIDTQYVTRIAGSGTAGSSDGTGVNATFNQPQGICYVAGNVYICDFNNHRIRRMNVSNFAVVTIAGSGSSAFADGYSTSASFSYPTSICVDQSFTTLYVTDNNNHRIRAIDIPSQNVTTIAGNGTATFNDGTGTSASFMYPFGVVVDPTNTFLYIVDSGNVRVRRINISTRVVTTIAGTGTSTSVDGPLGTSAFNTPRYLCINSSGDYIYVKDYNNLIRKIALLQGSRFDTTTFAGNGTTAKADTPRVPATYNSPSGCVADGFGNLYIADTNNNVIRQVDINGLTKILAGSGSGEAGFVDGIGLNARFNKPYDICIDSSQTVLYVADSVNHRIRKVDIVTGATTTLAGSGIASNTNGMGTLATFNTPRGLCISTDDLSLYIGDTLNHMIRKVDIATGVVTTVAGSGQASFLDGTGSLASFNEPHGVSLDSTNTKLWVADRVNNRIRQIVISTGVVSTFAGSGTAGFNNATGTSATFSAPTGIKCDTITNFLFVSDTGNNSIRRISVYNAQVVTLAGSTTAGLGNAIGNSATFNAPRGMAMGVQGEKLMVADSGNHVIRVIDLVSQDVNTNSVGTYTGSGVSALTNSILTGRFTNPRGICRDSTNTFVYFIVNHAILQLDLKTRACNVIAGDMSISGWVDATGKNARFSYPEGICIDATNTTLYITDRGNRGIRKVIISTGVVISVAGDGTIGDQYGIGGAAKFTDPHAICIDSTGTNLYITDRNATSEVSRVAGGTYVWGSTDGADPLFQNIYGICIDATNTILYLADSANNKIRKYDLSSKIASTIAGTGVRSTVDGDGTTATFDYPSSICLDT